MSRAEHNDSFAHGLTFLPRIAFFLNFLPLLSWNNYEHAPGKVFSSEKALMNHLNKQVCFFILALWRWWFRRIMCIAHFFLVWKWNEIVWSLTIWKWLYGKKNANRFTREPFHRFLYFRSNNLIWPAVLKQSSLGRRVMTISIVSMNKFCCC